MSYLKAATMGAVDGVITSFAVVAGALQTSSAEDNVSHVITVVGFSSLLADAFSMGVSEFLSSTSEGSVTDRRGTPALLGVLCFGSFVLFGIVPILMYLTTSDFVATILISLTELVGLGLLQARATSRPFAAEVVRTTLLGSGAGALAFTVAKIAAD